VEGSIRFGFDQWARTDLVTILDALKPGPESCMMMEMAFSERGGQPARLRHDRGSRRVGFRAPRVNFRTRSGVWKSESRCGSGDQDPIARADERKGFPGESSVPGPVAEMV
jgi:hypothetical protein